MLFRIAFMVEQKDVGTVYARIAGLKVFNVEPPSPVTIPSDKSVYDLINLKGKKEISTEEIKKMLADGGRSPKSLGYILTKLKKDKLVKPGKDRGVYTVLDGGVK